MTNLPNDAVVIATKAFLASMRRQFLKKHPGKECPVLLLEEYTVADQLRLATAIKAAIVATQPENIERVRAQILSGEGL